MNRSLFALALCVGLGGCAGQPRAPADVAPPVAAPKDGSCCARPDIVPILYGTLGVEGIAAVENGAAVHGGCYVGLGPRYYCRACRRELPAVPR